MAKKTVFISNNPEFIKQAKGLCETHGGTDVYEIARPQLSLVTGGGHGQKTPIRTLKAMEKEAIIEAIDFYRGNLSKASQALGIGRATMYRKMSLYKIDHKDSGENDTNLKEVA